MANGTESENYRDCSEIRPGMKREFAMMMNQSQFIGSIGRTRSSRSSGGGVIDNRTIKKTKSSEGENNREKLSLNEEKIDFDVENLIKNEAVSEEEEPKSGIVDLMSDDEKKSNLEEESRDPKDFKVESKEFKIENAIDEVQNVNVDVKSRCKEEGDSGEIICENSFSLRRITRSVSKSVKEEVKEEVAESNMMNMSSMVAATTGEANIKSEMRMPEKNVVEKPPMKLKELLETGLLEGLAVKYMRGSKVNSYESCLQVVCDFYFLLL